MPEPSNSPKWRPKYWENYLQPLWMRVCDVYAGLHTQETKQRYLRQQLGEHDLVYTARVQTVAFENRLSPSVKAHAGLLSEFELDDNAPATLVELDDDVDGQKNSLQAWLMDWDVDALLYNASLALVDVPEVKNETEQRQQRRPRFVQIPLKDVFAPRTMLVDGVLHISQLSVMRTVGEDDGDFGYDIKEKFWVYRLLPLEKPIRVGSKLQRYGAAYQVYEKDGDTEQYLKSEVKPIRDAAGRILDHIPIVWYSPYGDPVLFHGVDNDNVRGGTPEYMPLVDLNIEYFNKHSELNTAESRSNFVMLIKEYPGQRPKNEPDMLMSGRIAVLEGGAKLSMLEPEGTAISSTREGQRDRIKRMDAISQAFLTGGEAERTATEAVIETSQSRLGLRNIARRKESAVQQLCYWWERFSNPQFNPETDTVGGITVSESVLSIPATPEELRFWMDAWLNGGLSTEAWKAKMRELGEYSEEMELAETLQPAGQSLNLNFAGADVPQLPEVSNAVQQ